jgi:hypothetical protein
MKIFFLKNLLILIFVLKIKNEIDNFEDYKDAVFNQMGGNA